MEKKRLTKIKSITIKKEHFKAFIHINFIIGVLYAFYHYIRTPKSVDMYTRRLWAAETWVVFTLYSIFIYLFSIEVSSEDGEPVFYKLFRIKRFVKIKSAESISKTFDYIMTNPNKYKFDTHGGIFPIRGNITEPGSLFQTKEKFVIFPLTLTFATLNTTESCFKFGLLGFFKHLGIIGKFEVQREDNAEAKLYLIIYSESESILSHFVLGLIFISPIRLIIARQLKKELKFIKNLTENI